MAAAVMAGLACLGMAGPAGAVSAASGAVPAVGSWGKAIEVPGLAALNTGYAEVVSVSCTSAGNCAAGGDYEGRDSDAGFVVSERNGRWGKAIEVPGLAALNTGYAEVVSVSCASPGNCVLGGWYTDSTGEDAQGFVAAERHGRWGKAIEVPGLGALNAGGAAGVVSVSCASAGNCAAGGYYSDRRLNGQEFVAVERDGRWGKAIKVPGLGALNAGGNGEDAGDVSVSCASAGNCAVAGNYVDGSGNYEGLVISERNGRWGKAIKVPGLGALNAGGFGEVLSVSCGLSGNCAAGGFYTDGSARSQGFVVSERNGRWGKAIEVPGLGALNTGGDASVGSVSCTSAGNCAAGGSYTARHRRGQGFLVSERNGRWGKAIEVPGLGALNTGGHAGVGSVSCGSAGNCAAGGDYANGGGRQGFVVSERNGRWGKAIGVPGLGTLNAKGDADVISVSCAPKGNCAAGGHYKDRSFQRQAFVVSQARPA